MCCLLTGTCYRNASLQALARIDELVLNLEVALAEYQVTTSKYFALSQDLSKRWNHAVLLMQTLRALSRNDAQTAYKLSLLHHVEPPPFDEYRQHDPHEYITKTLDELRDFGTLIFNKNIINNLIGFIEKGEATCPRCKSSRVLVEKQHHYTLDVNLQRVSEILSLRGSGCVSATMDRVLEIWFSIGDSGDGQHICDECGANSRFKLIAPTPSELQQYLIVQARDYVFDLDEYRERARKNLPYYGKKVKAVEFVCILCKITLC